MAKGQRKSNREVKKPKKSAAEKSKSAAIFITSQAPGSAYEVRVKRGARPPMPSPLAPREYQHG